MPHQVFLTLQVGRILHAERLHAKGSIACLLTDEEKLAKFTDCLRWAGIEDNETHGIVAALGDAPSVRAALEGIARQLLIGASSHGNVDNGLNLSVAS